MKGVPLSVPANTPAPVLSNHLEIEARRRKLAFMKAKDARGELPILKVTQMDISATMTSHFTQLYTARASNHALKPHCVVLPREQWRADNAGGL